MNKFSEVLRLIALAVLSGGSAAVVFVAVTLVKSQTATGIPVSEAAAANAPAFINFAKVASGAAIALLIAEAISLMTQPKTKMLIARAGASAICIVSTLIFAFVFVPPMAELQPQIKNDQAKYEEFHKLHELSRAVFSGTILFAFAALLIPVFGSGPSASKTE